MHEEATSMSVPSSVAVSTVQNENNNTPSAVITADVNLEITPDNGNIEIEVPFSSDSGGYPYSRKKARSNRTSNRSGSRAGAFAVCTAILSEFSVGACASQTR
ncbi:hypothetical protein HHI36_020270 [Cryptolaemus montrouzieri]|uniref:Uncharacterized protein n=1 Tax=Cryptolaemus montrouzieri TaxID=559131 RepID=A0ABD2N9R4_9CUCU